MDEENENTNNINYDMNTIRSNASQKVKSNYDQPIDKVPYIKGEKTILCWNCQSILMVKEEWSVIQCTNCQKINRIPGTEKKEPLPLNDCTNHFDLYLPYVVSIYKLIICFPYTYVFFIISTHLHFHNQVYSHQLPLL